jgi:hypothetical protein
MSSSRETFEKFLQSIEEGVIRAEMKTGLGTGHEVGFASLRFRNSFATDDEFKSIIDYLTRSRNQVTKVDFIGSHKLTKQTAQYLDGIAAFIGTYQIRITGMDQDGYYGGPGSTTIPDLIAHKYLDEYFSKNCQGHQFSDVEDYKKQNQVLLIFERITVKNTFRRKYVEKNADLENRVMLLENRVMFLENRVVQLEQNATSMWSMLMAKLMEKLSIVDSLKKDMRLSEESTELINKLTETSASE